MRPTPTIRQLALLAGVSRTTVSLSLRNHPSIPAATRERIQKLAQQEGYQIDPLVATLMTQLRIARRRRTQEKLVYLTSWNERDAWRASPNDAAFHEGAQIAASRLGYDVEHIWSQEPGLTGRRLSKILYTRGIRGVIIAPLPRPHRHIALEWPHFAAAAISETIVEPHLHRTTHAHGNGMKVMLQRLKEMGYQRIGLANLQEHESLVGRAWEAFYYVHYHSLPAAQRIPPLFLPAWEEKPFKEWVRHHRPDVVVSNQLQPLHLLQASGHSVPDEIGYACLDLAASQNLGIAGIDQLPRLVAAAAVDLVVTQLQNNEFGVPQQPKIVQLDGCWRDGKTLRARPAAVAAK